MKQENLYVDEAGFLSVIACIFASVILLLGSALVYVAAREQTIHWAYQQETQIDMLLQDALLQIGNQISSGSDMTEKLEEKSNLPDGENLLLHEENRTEIGRPVRIRIYGREKDGYIILTGTADALLLTMHAKTRQRRLKRMLWQKKEGHYVYCGRLP